ncbi:uncharacterized protein BDV17DRAFT_232594 [Aspergillus undulatus]|uniref:uncharacterized protein n=1 Tax=Aspergillus undulatus TaxID=1810928 RepID=UPI003CCCD750
MGWCRIWAGELRRCLYLYCLFGLPDGLCLSIHALYLAGFSASLLLVRLHSMQIFNVIIAFD